MGGALKQALREAGDGDEEVGTKRAEKQKKLGKMLMAALTLIVLLMVLMGAMMAVMLHALKGTWAVDTWASGAPLTKTSAALSPLPLVVAPVMTIHQLDAVESLTLSYIDPHYHSATGEDQKIRLAATVDTVVKVNDTAVIFQLASPTWKEVRVWNGEAKVHLADSSSFDVCDNDVSCSALMVEDASAAAKMEAKAQAALEAAGFAVTAASSKARRR